MYLNHHSSVLAKRSGTWQPIFAQISKTAAFNTQQNEVLHQFRLVGCRQLFSTQKFFGLRSPSNMSALVSPCLCFLLTTSYIKHISLR